MNKIEITLQTIPDIEGLHFRKFQGVADFPTMVTIVNAAGAADKDEGSSSLEDVKNIYQHLSNCNPEEDMIFAEVNDSTVAYSRVWWFKEENPVDYIYFFILYILPEWRNQGIEKTIIKWCEKRIDDIAVDHPAGFDRFFQTYTTEYKPGYNAILEDLGYQPVRFFIEMSRLLVDIPSADLPEGVEVRPALEKDVHKIWEASNEASREHWGFSEQTEEDFQRFISHKFFQPDLWQVAWYNDQVVGSVLNFIDHDYNKECNKKRGWTESITTCRDWRRKGIAGALICRSMHMHKNMGMEEVALNVDTENVSGALKIYERLGYKKGKTMTHFRKRKKD